MFTSLSVYIVFSTCARGLEKQNRSQMSQVLFGGARSSHQAVLLFKDSKARRLSPAGATPGAAYLALHLVGLRRGRAREEACGSCGSGSDLCAIIGSMRMTIRITPRREWR